MHMISNGYGGNDVRFSVERTPRRAAIVDVQSAQAALALARDCFMSGKHNEGIDLYEQLIELIPSQAIDLLAELHDLYKTIPNQSNRYSLYVSRYYDFQIQPGDKVLDIGSGHDPFPLATHLADFAPNDDHYGRAGTPLKRPEGKPFFECGVEKMPFADKEFDFIYCSHVLEHAEDPAQACRELMRVGKRGFIETPTRGKDLWLNSGKASNHIWAVENFRGKLIFTQYTPQELNGLACNILMDMHCSPQSVREKAFSAVILLKSREVNTMLYWESSIECEVRRL